jgi:hypothetical protein
MGMSLPKAVEGPLIASLRRFQVGESGEGHHLKSAAAQLGPAYEQAIHLFIDEEKNHADMLAGIIERLDGDLMRWHWSDLAFIVLRRLMGLKQELMVLLIAEMIAKVYYRVLDEGIQDLLLNTIFSRIRNDEEAHIAFHLDTLRSGLQSHPFVLRSLLYLLWRTCFSAVCLVVIIDHRPILDVLGSSKLEFWRACHHIFEDAAWMVFRPKRTLWHSSLSDFA